MGFLDSILGKTKLREAQPIAIAISTAAITLEANLGLKPEGAAAVCISPWIRPGTKLLMLKSRISSSPRFKETGTGYKIQKDEFNYIWVVLKDKDFEDLATNVQI